MTPPIGNIGSTRAVRVTWAGREDVGRLSGRTVRLQFRMREARLFALQFQAGDGSDGGSSAPPGERPRRAQ